MCKQTQVWCQNTCQNCMSGTDVDNAAASQTELNRRNGGANSGVVGTIIPREEIQQLLKQQTLLPSQSQKHMQRVQMGDTSLHNNLGESSSAADF